jgi:hypothetical protein
MVIALTCALFVGSANAVRELVVIEQPRLAQRLEGLQLGGLSKRAELHAT